MGKFELDTGVVVDTLDTLPCPACGVVLDVSDIDPFDVIACVDCDEEMSVPAKIGIYELQGLIGKGAMGGVYLAEDMHLKRKVAIKVILSAGGYDESMTDQFAQEARAIALLNHPNIAQVFAFDRANGQPYIVMELVSGKRLDQMIENESPIDQALLVQMAIDTSAGLEAAAQKSLVHGDIKPENILFDKKQKAKLVDFGLANFGGRQADGRVWGTPHYIAPERLQGKKVDPRADMYSLGATLYHALTGQTPFSGDNGKEIAKKRLTEPPPPIAELRPDALPELVRIIERMMAVDVSKRYPTHKSIIGDLGRAQKLLGSPSRHRGGTQRIKTAGRTQAMRSVPGKKGPSSPARQSGSRARRTEPKKPKVLIPIVAGVLVLGAIVLGIVKMSGRNEAPNRPPARRAVRPASPAPGQRDIVALRGRAVSLLKQARAAETQFVSKSAEIDQCATELIKTGEPYRRLDAGIERLYAKAKGWQATVASHRTRLAEHREGLTMLGRAGAENDPAQLVRQTRRLEQSLELFRRAGGDLEPVLVEAQARRSEMPGLLVAAKWKAEEKKKLDATKKAQLERDRRATRAEQERVAALEARQREVDTFLQEHMWSPESWSYTESRTSYEQKLASVRTPEARTLLAREVTRLKLMEALHKHVMDRLQEAPFRGGWVHGRKTYDITSANAAGVLVRSVTVPWSDVPPAQGMRLVNHALTKLPVSSEERGRLYLAGALFAAGAGDIGSAIAWRNLANGSSVPTPVLETVESGEALSKYASTAAAMRTTSALSKLIDDAIGVLASAPPGVFGDLPVKLELWMGMPGADLNLMKESGRLKETPDEVWTLPALAIGDKGTHYAARARSLLVPNETGTYLFTLYADDQGELRLSATDQARGLRPIAFADAPCEVLEIKDARRQVSKPIRLVAGRAYLIEVLWKQGAESDLAVIHWQRAGRPPEQIPSECLRPRGVSASPATRQAFLAISKKVAGGQEALDALRGTAASGDGSSELVALVARAETTSRELQALLRRVAPSLQRGDARR